MEPIKTLYNSHFSHPSSVWQSFSLTILFIYFFLFFFGVVVNTLLNNQETSKPKLQNTKFPNLIVHWMLVSLSTLESWQLGKILTLLVLSYMIHVGNITKCDFDVIMLCETSKATSHSTNLILKLFVSNWLLQWFYNYYVVSYIKP